MLMSDRSLLAESSFVGASVAPHAMNCVYLKRENEKREREKEGRKEEKKERGRRKERGLVISCNLFVCRKMTLKTTH
jgi:hypothetical protein